MTTNLLCLNPSRTEFLIVGLSEQLSKLTYSSDLFPTELTSPCTFHFPCTLHFSSLQSWSHFTFTDHITTLSKISYMHIRDLCRLRPILDYNTACTIATSIVYSKLDYCNSLFYSINSSQIERLQTFRTLLPAQARTHENSNIIT